MKQTIYQKLYEQAQSGSNFSNYIDAADVAKVIRFELGRNFPGTKFGVKTDKYSGGASIDIFWTDGPSEKSVKDICDYLEGSSFDGSIDLKTNNEHYITPSGIVFGGTNGTAGSMGYIETVKYPAPSQGIKVSLMADYIFYYRDFSSDVILPAIDQLNNDWGTNYSLSDYNKGMIFDHNHARALRQLLESYEDEKSSSS